MVTFTILTKVDSQALILALICVAVAILGVMLLPELILVIKPVGTVLTCTAALNASTVAPEIFTSTESPKSKECAASQRTIIPAKPLPCCTIKFCATVFKFALSLITIPVILLPVGMVAGAPVYKALTSAMFISVVGP